MMSILNGKTTLKYPNVLVTGASGFVGCNLVKRLLTMGANVRAAIHHKDAVIKDDRIDYIKVDLLKMEDCKKVVQGMDYVFHCAANTSGAAVIASTPLAHVTPNVVMNSQLLEAAYFGKVKKFVWLSSNAAYPDSGSRPVREEEMFDGDPYDIYYGVAWMKRYTETLCRLYSEKIKNGMATVVLRPSNIYGPYDDFDFVTSHMMAATIRKVVERQKPIKVWGDGNDIRDLIYIDDFIDAMILAAEKIETYNPINVGYGKGYSVKETLRMCVDIDNYSDALIEYDSSKPSMIPARNISIDKAKRLLGFEPRTDIRIGIEKTINWYRAENQREE